MDPAVIASFLGEYSSGGDEIAAAIAPYAKSLCSFCFASKGLTTAVNFPLVTIVCNSAFASNIELPSVFLLEASEIGSDAFVTCNALSEISIPSVRIVGYRAFLNCYNLPKIDLAYDLSNTAMIKDYAFYGCSKLSTVVLRKTATYTNTGWNLGGVNAFGGTPIESGTGYIYVPSNSVDRYKAATNWATYADQFRALEDYTVDGTTTGELDETKI